MSLDKAIEHGKEHRKPFRRSKAFDTTCRNHGSCTYCENNRKFFDKKKRAASDYDIKHGIDEFEEMKWEAEADAAWEEYKKTLDCMQTDEHDEKHYKPLHNEDIIDEVF